jgi:chromosome segregation ATPase
MKHVALIALAALAAVVVTGCASMDSVSDAERGVRSANNRISLMEVEVDKLKKALGDAGKEPGKPDPAVAALKDEVEALKRRPAAGPAQGVAEIKDEIEAIKRRLQTSPQSLGDQIEKLEARQTALIKDIGALTDRLKDLMEKVDRLQAASGRPAEAVRATETPKPAEPAKSDIEILAKALRENQANMKEMNDRLGQLIQKMEAGQKK